MINCPECGKEISSRANVCPNCGYPICEDFGNAAGGNQRVEVMEKVPVVEATPKSCKVLKLISALMMLGGLGGCVANIGDLDRWGFCIGVMVVGLVIYFIVGLYVWWNHG